MLDEALLRLREKDRQAVLLRFFEGRNNREIGQALGIGEDAARKRVDKALEGMTAFFRKRGYAAGSSSITTAALVSGAHMASARLATTVMQAVMTQKGDRIRWICRFVAGPVSGLEPGAAGVDLFGCDFGARPLAASPVSVGGGGTKPPGGIIGFAPHPTS
jgi:hypothetical protein